MSENPVTFHLENAPKKPNKIEMMMCHILEQYIKKHDHYNESGSITDYTLRLSGNLVVTYGGKETSGRMMFFIIDETPEAVYEVNYEEDTNSFYVTEHTAKYASIYHPDGTGKFIDLENGTSASEFVDI